LSFKEAQALTDLCEDYYEEHGHWPDGHVTELKKFCVEDVPNDMLDELVKEGRSSLISAAEKKWGLSFKEAQALTDLCEDYYKEHGHWPDGHVTELKIKN
jgi:delta-aminolevulinic acid dehydratase/porphobilinogen synthase